MASPSTSPPSEGEIIESDSEKATTAITTDKGTSVDRPFRKRLSVSQSPSPIGSPRRYKSRTVSRSPYRESRGAKRTVDDDHYDRSRNDPRRFKIRYEDHLPSDRPRTRNPYSESDRSAGPDRIFRHEDRNGSGRPSEKQPRTRSRSPIHSQSQRTEYSQYSRRSHGGQGSRDRWREQSDRGYGESSSKLSREQSVSDRGYSPIAAARLRQETESRNNQTQHMDNSAEYNRSTAKYVPQSLFSQITDTTRKGLRWKMELGSSMPRNW